MKVRCCRCSTRIELSNGVSESLIKYYKKHKVYLCGFCRRRLGLFYDPKKTIKYLKENYEVN